MKIKTFQYSVFIRKQNFRATSAEPPPMGNRKRPRVGSQEIAFEKKKLYVITQRNIYFLMNRYCFYKLFLLENKTSGQPQQSPPPRGNRKRPIGPSTVPGRAHYPSGGGGGAA